MNWTWKTFDSLTAAALYEVLALRQRVFVVEQACAYQDADGLDAQSLHLFGRDERGALIAYARLSAPGVKYAEPAIGRVLVVPERRRQGLGQRAVELAIQESATRYPDSGIRLSGQQYLDSFYTKLGFKTQRGPFDEDGIPHLEMLRPPAVIVRQSASIKGRDS